MNSKANLKAAREAIGAKNFNEAVKACNRVLLWESENYNAWVFLGVAYTGLEDDEEAEKSYRRAIEINPDQLLAWQGLVSFYEKRKRFEEMAKTIQDILPKVAASGDGNRVADYLEKLIHLYENDEKNKDKYIHYLKMYLPGNPIYDLVKDAKTARHPKDIWWTIVRLTEEDQARLIDSRVQSRRYNVNAGPLDQVRAQVEAEVYADSKLGEMYEALLDLAKQDGSDTLELHLKLLEFWYKRLPCVSRKEQLCKDILELAHSLAAQQVHASLPYEILIEFTDAKSIDDYDTNLLNRLVDQYPDTGLSKLIRGYRLYHEGQIDEAFDAFGEGLDIVPNNLFGYLGLCWIYYDCKEYETGLEYATKGRDLVRKRGKETSRLLANMIMSMELCMAHCYRHMDTKYYPDAMGLYEKILNRDENEIGALEGAGLIFQEEGRYDEALLHFEKVFKLEPQRHIALAEIGWIYCQKEEYEKAIDYILKAIESTDQEVAEYYYRLGRVYWSMGDDYRKDTNYAFKFFIKAVKLDPQFPDGFTFLGHYYRSMQEDHVRAKKCYSKAYLLNPLDVDAAWHLSNYHIQDNELAEAEALFQHITETSPKTGWAWRRLGFAKMNQDHYDEAITCFQKALRTDTSDVQCWEGLAESYAHEGRYVAALKAFGRATDLCPTSIHGNCAKALVKQKIGLLDEAVAGFRKTLKIAESQGKVDYVPALKGLADTFLEQTKEEIQLGFFGRAAETCSSVIKTSLRGLKQDIAVVGFWKLIGDACSIFRTIPTCLHLCAYTDLQEVMKLLLDTCSSSPHDQLKFPEADVTVRLLQQFLSLESFNVSPKEALDIVLSCATFAYKQALMLCKNHPMIAPGLWHDLALLYHWIGENGQAANAQEVADTAMLCIRRAIKMESAQYQFWNALGVMSMQSWPKISQYALVKAMELNSRSAVPWTNYGFLCLAQKDYELANEAFETAHALDPEWISAWVGQAHVASLWGNEAASIFQHAFESSNGSSLEASYGYAETIFSQLTTTDSSSKDANLIISPAFALQKLTEQRLDNALALNLLGLLLERLGQFERASAAFLQAIEALDTQCKRGSLNDEEFNCRIAKVHANLGRSLCATGSFQAAIESYDRAIEHGSGSLRVYCQLGAGIAYYFEEQLEESLAMFETALAETEDDTDLRLDVNVLLSQVLWALGGEEQRQVAKNQLFGSIADDPSYLPAIFSLCAMGLLENDETLANAALQELGKVPTDTVYKNDKEHWIPWLFSRYYLLQNEPRQAMRSLARSVHQFPWMAGLWRRLASNALNLSDDSESYGTIQHSMTSAALALAADSKTESTDAKAEAYELAARAYLINSSESEQENRLKASRLAQRAAMIAPWRISAWQTLANA